MLILTPLNIDHRTDCALLLILVLYHKSQNQADGITSVPQYFQSRNVNVVASHALWHD